MPRCKYCDSEYVNYMNFCLMCRKQQPSSPLMSPEKKESLINDIRMNPDLGSRELARKHGVDESTVRRWRRLVREGAV